VNDRSHDLAPYRDSSAGFELRLPVGWDVLADSQLGAALVVLEPDRGGDYRSSIVVTVEELAAGTELSGWQDDAMAVMPSVLEDFFLIDQQTVHMDGHEVLHRVAHHVADPPRLGATAVTMGQWATVSAGLGFTVTATAGTADWFGAASLFDAVAETFTVLPARRGGGR
jgi:hypothetical protein